MTGIGRVMLSEAAMLVGDTASGNLRKGPGPLALIDNRFALLQATDGLDQLGEAMLGPLMFVVHVVGQWHAVQSRIGRSGVVIAPAARVALCIPAPAFRSRTPIFFFIASGE